MGELRAPVYREVSTRAWRQPWRRVAVLLVAALWVAVPSGARAQAQGAIPAWAQGSPQQEATPGFTQAELARWQALSAMGFSVLVPSLRAPKCEDVFVYIVASSIADGRATATLTVGQGGQGNAYRVGARAGPYLVIAIGDNRRRLSPAVWLARDGVVCQALLRDANPKRASEVRRARGARAKQYARHQREAQKRALQGPKKKKKKATKRRKAGKNKKK